MQSSMMASKASAELMQAELKQDIEALTREKVR